MAGMKYPTNRNDDRKAQILRQRKEAENAKKAGNEVDEQSEVDQEEENADSESIEFEEKQDLFDEISAPKKRGRKPSDVPKKQVTISIPVNMLDTIEYCAVANKLNPSGDDVFKSRSEYFEKLAMQDFAKNGKRYEKLAKKAKAFFQNDDN